MTDIEDCPECGHAATATRVLSSASYDTAYDIVYEAVPCVPVEDVRAVVKALLKAPHRSACGIEALAALARPAIKKLMETSDPLAGHPHVGEPFVMGKKLMEGEESL